MGGLGFGISVVQLVTTLTSNTPATRYPPDGGATEEGLGGGGVPAFFVVCLIYILLSLLALRLLTTDPTYALVLRSAASASSEALAVFGAGQKNIASNWRVIRS